MPDPGIRVVLIEKNPDQVRMLKEMLSSITRSRFEVSACPDVNRAVQFLAGHPCDVALLHVLDCSAPPGDALQRLRLAGRGMPVVLLCPNDSDVRGDVLLQQGAHDYLGLEHLDRQTLALSLRHAADRHRSEEELRRERDLLRTLIDNLPDHIYVKDMHSGFILNNAAHLKFLGAARQEEVTGKTDLDVFPPGVGDTFFAEEQEIIRTGEPLIGREEHNVDSSGREHWVSSTKVPWRDESGRILGIVGMSRDITRRKFNEQKLREQNMRLEEFARSEHDALEQLKLAQSHMVQSEKLAGLGQMVAGVAHEMNNPLAFVGNNLAVAQRDLISVCELVTMYREADPLITARQPDLMRRISATNERIDIDYTVSSLQQLLLRSREGIDRIRQIVRDLCDFARLDTSDQEEADINEGIRSTLNIVAGAAKNKGVALELELGSIPRVACYPAKVNQVVMNLLSNAIDACTADGRVIVRTQSLGDHVEIVIADNGSGIDPAIHQRVFDPFFTTKAPGKGTGLGLSISYGIVRAHGGEITFESAPGAGTVFKVKLPARVQGVRVQGSGKSVVG
jgi:two-component system NtrC family sensor kinase